MAHSIQRAVSDGTLNLLDLSINYIERAEISVYFNNVPQAPGTTWAWVGSVDKKISFTPKVPNGVEVLVKRTTDLSDLRHRYSAGAAFTAGSVDESLEQVLHIAQEATEGALGGDFFQDIDMHTYKIKNLGPATSPTDAVSLGQYQADAAGANVARNEAVAAKDTAVAAKDTAVAAKATAVTSSTSAHTSASTATSQAGIATTKASEAAASAASALTSKNSATSSATDATASKNAAAASATAAANSAAAALNPWQVISPTEIRYAGKAGLYGAGNRLDFWNANYYIRAYNGLEITAADHVRITAAGGEQLRADVNGVGVQMPPVAGAGILQTQYRSTVWARDTKDTPHMEVVASDFMSLPSWKSVRLQYNGQGVAGNLPFCPSVAASNTSQLEALYTDALVISTNNDAPVVVAAGGAERLRIGRDGVCVHTPVGLGYGTGAGGTAIQPTNKSTAVVLNKPSGRITMHPESLAAGAIAVFKLSNSIASPSAVLALTFFQDGITDPRAYNVWAQALNGGGGFNVFVRNISGAALSNAVQISFAVLEGAIA